MRAAPTRGRSGDRAPPDPRLTGNRAEAAGTLSSPAASAALGRLRFDHLNPRSRRLLLTTKTLENAIAAPAIMGLSNPMAASGRAATL